MIVDANLLVYAYNADAPEHTAATTWLTAQLTGTARVGLPWQSLIAFVRLTTSAALFAAPLSPSAAWRQVEEWLAAPRAWVPLPTSGYASTFARLLGAYDVRGPLVTDAALAALALDHGVAVASTDRDFARFSEVTWVNPLA